MILSSEDSISSIESISRNPLKLFVELFGISVDKLRFAFFEYSEEKFNSVSYESSLLVFILLNEGLKTFILIFYL